MNMSAGSPGERRANPWSRREQKYFRPAAVPRATPPTALASVHLCSVWRAPPSNLRRARPLRRTMPICANPSSCLRPKSFLAPVPTCRPFGAKSRKNNSTTWLPISARSVRRNRSQRKRGRNEYGHAGTTRARAEKLSERGLRLEVLAVYAGPQAHRAVVHGFGHVLLRHRRVVRRSDAHSPRRAAGRAGAAGNLQQIIHAARRRDDFLFPDSVDPRGPGKFSGALDGWRSRPRLSEAESAELVHLHRGRVVHVVFGDRGRRGYRMDVLYALQQHVLEHAGHGRGDRGVHHRVFLDPDGPELHRYDSQNARS